MATSKLRFRLILSFFKGGTSCSGTVYRALLQLVSSLKNPKDGDGERCRVRPKTGADALLPCKSRVWSLLSLSASSLGAYDR